jgi:hypothetical protein
MHPAAEQTEFQGVISAPSSILGLSDAHSSQGMKCYKQPPGKALQGCREPQASTSISRGTVTKPGSLSSSLGALGGEHCTYMASETSWFRSLAGASCRDCDPPILAAPWRAG